MLHWAEPLPLHHRPMQPRQSVNLSAFLFSLAAARVITVPDLWFSPRQCKLNLLTEPCRGCAVGPVGRLDWACVYSAGQKHLAEVNRS